jgi:hypothetical protein
LIEIDESLLVRLAGARAFGRGLHCFEADCVREVVTTDTTTRAIVEDGRRHAVRLRHTHRMMEGECDCEISDGIEFCQHCVAVALQLQAQQTLSKPTDKRTAIRQIRRHLSALSHEDLLDEFLEAIKQDRALREDMFQKARLSVEAMSYSELKKMIDTVGAEDFLYEPREIRAYFHRLEAMLARLTEFADKLDPLVLLRSVEYAVRRFNTDFALIDYAADFPDRSMDMLIDLHRTAMGRLNWPPKDLASYLIDCGVSEQWHPFGSLASLYCDDLGPDFHEAALAEIESRCNALAKNAVTGIAREPTCRLLTQIEEDLSAGCDP